MDKVIRAEPLTAAAFARFGDVIEAAGEPVTINAVLCDLYKDLARLDFGPEGRAKISVARSRPVALPLVLEMMERHPLGSQIFMPMQSRPFLVVVAPDDGGEPGRPVAFVTSPGQGVNYLRATWHGVLSPLGEAGDFLMVDREGPGSNVEEHHFDVPWTVEAGG